MPLLDVTEVLTDPDFADTFVVTRRAEAVDSHGRSVVTPQVFNGVVGVICFADPTSLQRSDGSQMTSRVISVITKFRLRASAEGVQPDQVTWAGATYTVKDCKPYTRYGAGFVEAIAESMNASDTPMT